MALAKATAEDVMAAMQEVVVPEELERVLSLGGAKGYIGIEPSGLLTTGQAFQIARGLKLLNDAGVHMRVLLADWHAYINDKLGSDMERIRACGAYIQEALVAMGVDTDMTTYVYASEYMGDAGYWELVIRVSKASSLSRIKRALTIMGRGEDEAASKLIYPAMQVSDIYYMDLDIALGGMDQRKAHMLAREAATKVGKKVKSPVALHFALLPSLTGDRIRDERPVIVEENGKQKLQAPAHISIDAKMSKSRPETAIFIHDSTEIIKSKLKGAFCPAGVVEGNPVTELARLIVLPLAGALEVKRPAKFGGDVSFDSWDALAQAYTSGALHPADLKTAVASGLAELQRPVREHFDRNPVHKRFEAGASR
jgi:tyrosyl-tRNA synthetase